MAKYNVVIVGAGPAGIFAALELAERSNLRVLVVDRGRNIEKRICPARENSRICQKCTPCSLLCGWGGAGAFSDGKLTLSREVGGQLTAYIDEKEFASVLDYVDKVYLRFGGTARIYGTDGERVEELRKRAEKAELILVPSQVRHLGTDRCRDILRNIFDYLKERIEVRTLTAVDEILVKDRVARGVRLETGEEIESSFVIVA
ncbi:MAG: FAD-dependent oxidoreductase, partial [Candidatus Caldatribacterium sp.]|nr:FAD-dependent oxidoreductase [Candidatus Caldatribacterium sp.]